MMMVAAFAGKDFLMHAYEEAIKNEYKFYSYGDAMLIIYCLLYTSRCV